MVVSKEKIYKGISNKPMVSTTNKYYTYFGVTAKAKQAVDFIIPI